MKRFPIRTIVVGITIIVLGLPTLWAKEAAPSASHATPPPVLLCKSPYKKKPVPAKTLQALVRSHERWVEYRGNPDAKRIELCQADLSRAELTGANLERAALEGAILRQAKLAQATLAQASLAGA